MFEGSFDADMPSGSGKEWYPDGGPMQYYGQFWKAQRHGFGTLFHRDGSVSHAGDFRNGKPFGG